MDLQPLRAMDDLAHKSINAAAALAKLQLQYAQQVVEEVRPGRGDEPVLIAAVLHAIASNFSLAGGR